MMHSERTVYPISEQIVISLRNTFKSLSEDYFFECLNEFLKFIYICSAVCKESGDSSFLSVSKEIDEFWHAYILQTKEYRELCLSLPAKKFLDHGSEPFDAYANKNGHEKSITIMMSHMCIYYDEFGPLQKSVVKHWSIPNHLINLKKLLTLQQFNEAINDELSRTRINPPRAYARGIMVD